MKLPNNDNAYLVRAAKAMDRLTKIYDHDIEYTPDDYPILINTFERFYKGIFIELRKMYPDNPHFKVSDEEICSNHKFSWLVTKINRVLPVSRSKDGYMVILNHANELGQRYSPGRFDVEYDFMTFQQDYMRLQGQMTRLNGLLQQKQQEKVFEKEEDYWR